MTQDTKHAPRRAATSPGPRIGSGAGSRAGIPAATLAALLLAGCSSGNIGESWQCPLAKGGSCDSVAAADPAVPDAGGGTVLGEPLWQVRGSAPEPRSETVCTAGCGGGFDPFAWLARLFGDPGSSAGTGSNAGGDERSAALKPDAATAAKTGTVPAGPDREVDAAASSAAPEAAEAEAAALPAEPALAVDRPQADDLRTGEVVARIWIAPFVDADGVYREASYIRVVLEPAGWRLK